PIGIGMPSIVLASSPGLPSSPAGVAAPSSPSAASSSPAGPSGPSVGGRFRPRRRHHRANTLSYTSRSSRRRTKTAWPAARTVSRWPMSTRVRARAKSTAAPRSVWIPAARSARPKPTDSARRRRPSTTGPHGARTIAGSCGSRGTLIGRARRLRARLGEIGPSRRAPDPPDVLLVLEDDAERLVDHLAGQLARPERQEGGRPVERLGDPGHLRQVGLAQAMDEADDVAGEALWCVRDAGDDDLELLLGRRIVDPVVQAAALERVVDLARPVRGQD